MLSEYCKIFNTIYFEEHLLPATSATNNLKGYFFASVSFSVKRLQVYQMIFGYSKPS